jgi:hypothetical protein
MPFIAVPRLLLGNAGGTQNKVNAAFPRSRYLAGDLRAGRRLHQSAWKRAMLKYGTTYIIWVTAPPHLPPEKVLLVEADLIEALNPSKNIKRPTPPDTVQDEATDMFKGFRSTIHAVRRDQVEERGSKRLTPEARWNRIFRKRCGTEM